MKPNIKDPNSWIPKELFEIYFGGESEKLSAFYDKAAEKKNIICFSVNWLALLLLPAWLGYRKQWALWGTVTGLFAFLPFAEALLKLPLPNAGFLGASLVIGFMANGFLLMSANAKYFKLKESGATHQEIESELRDQAKPSGPFAFAAFFGYLAIVGASSYIADTFIGLPG